MYWTIIFFVASLAWSGGDGFDAVEAIVPSAQAACCTAQVADCECEGCPDCKCGLDCKCPGCDCGEAVCPCPLGDQCVCEGECKCPSGSCCGEE
ncbi:MAG: hypothetical protein JW959_09355 [Pirellulales bacterium]|nr:hypothetical protein [Pirellulales bacterium]